MADRTFSEPGIAAGLGTIAPPTDEYGQETGVAQPGQLHAGPADPLALRIKHTSEADGFNSLDQASDTFAVITMVVDQTKAFQLLAPDQNRKSAVIMCFTNAVILGDQGSIANVLPGTIAGGTLGVFALPASSLTPATLFAFEYTSKRGLWVASGVAGQVAQVQCLVERFNSGTPVV